MSQRYDHFGYESHSRLYDNSRVEPESWEEQFTEQLAEQVDKDKCDQATDDGREPANADH